MMMTSNTNQWQYTTNATTTGAQYYTTSTYTPTQTITYQQSPTSMTYQQQPRTKLDMKLDDIRECLRDLDQWRMELREAEYQANMVKRLPAPREFNRFINASDLVSDFIGYLGEQKVAADDVMGMPLELFIKWLVVKACEQDGEEPNVTLELPHQKKPRCLGCGKYMRRGVDIPLHTEPCAPRYFARRRELDRILQMAN